MSSRRKGTVLASGRYTPWDLTNIAQLDPSDPEWERAWRERRELTGDDDLDAEDPITGEVWQYMDTSPYEGEWSHCFRHRNHPVTQDRWYVRVPVDPSWVEDQRRRGRIMSYRNGVIPVGDRRG